MPIVGISSREIKEIIVLCYSVTAPFINIQQMERPYAANYVHLFLLDFSTI